MCLVRATCGVGQEHGVAGLCHLAEVAYVPGPTSVTVVAALKGDMAIASC